MSKPTLTQKQLAEVYVCGLATIRRAKADGVDVQDRNAFAGWVKTKQKPPHAWINGVPWEQNEETMDAASAEMRELSDQVRDAPNYDVARTLKTKIDSLMQIRKIEILEGDYIHKEEVVSELARIGAAVLVMVKQFQADLPAMIEGLTASESKKTIGTYSHRVLSMLADETSKLWK